MDIDSTSETAASTDGSKRVIIAIDLGTTFSTVSYVCIPPGADDAVRSAFGPDDVECINSYPDIPWAFGPSSTTQTCVEVPTEIWYNKASSFELGLDKTQPANGASSDIENDSAAEQVSVITKQAHPQKKKKRKGPTPRDIAWGYGVQSMMQHKDCLANTDAKISKFKLMLDSEDRSITHETREQVNKICSILKRERVITDRTQVISDYLTKLLSHTKARLEATRSLTSDTNLDFVICVPNIWREQALRTMHNVTATAIKSSGLGDLIDSRTIDNLFIVSEPEAAATFVLADVKHHDDKLLPGEVFVLLDAGGGTVDATTYRVTQTQPLRLREEVVQVGGAMCGSSFLNDKYRAVLTERLKGQQPPRGLTLDGTIEALVYKFEHVGKRHLDVTTDDRIEPDRIRWLQTDPQRRIDKDGYIYWTKGEMRGIFQECLDGVKDVLQKQLAAAAQRSDPVTVKKVILNGGFGRSKSLQSHLRQFLQTEQNYIGRPIDLVIPHQHNTSSVARGAVLRALNKKNGPQRHLQTSFGFLRTELHDPSNVAAHIGIKPTPDKVDGFDSIEDTIYWVLQKVSKNDTAMAYLIRQTYQPRRACASYLSTNTSPSQCGISLGRTQKSSSAKRYYSYRSAITNRAIADTTTRTQVSNTLISKPLPTRITRLTSPPTTKTNIFLITGAQRMATININMTSLRDDGHLKLVYPKGVDNPDPSRLHYRIEMDLFVIVENRNLSFEAVWPARDSEERRQGAKEVRRKGTVSIASSFAPGTA